MSKRKPKIFNPKSLIAAIRKWPIPLHDLKHGFDIYVEGRARSNQTREEHIIEYGHGLKARDLNLVPKVYLITLIIKRTQFIKTHLITTSKGREKIEALSKYQLG